MRLVPEKTGVTFNQDRIQIKERGCVNLWKTAKFLGPRIHFNPWRGCTKVAAGCQNCYAERQAKRNANVLGQWGIGGTRVLASEDQWRKVLKWQHDYVSGLFGQVDYIPSTAKIEPTEERIAGREPTPFVKSVPNTLIFCGSMCDVWEHWTGQLSHSDGDKLWWVNEANQAFTLHKDVKDIPRDAGRPMTLSWVRENWLRQAMLMTPNCIWQMLTKRPENIPAMMPKFPYGDKWPNVWLGVSVANQEDALRNIPLLAKCRHLAAKLFVSVEPLVDRVMLTECEGFEEIDFVIIGGESGHGARPCDIAWVRDCVSQCRRSGAAVFVKQLGSCAVNGSNQLQLVHPKGGDMSEFPEDLMIREFPYLDGRS